MGARRRRVGRDRAFFHPGVAGRQWHQLALRSLRKQALRHTALTTLAYRGLSRLGTARLGTLGMLGTARLGRAAPHHARCMIMIRHHSTANASMGVRNVYIAPRMMPWCRRTYCSPACRRACTHMRAVRRRDTVRCIGLPNVRASPVCPRAKPRPSHARADVPLWEEGPKREGPKREEKDPREKGARREKGCIDWPAAHLRRVAAAKGHPIAAIHVPV